MKKYTLRILDGTSKGYTETIICDEFKSNSNGYYYFYNLKDKVERVGYTEIAYYPISKTIIEKIEDNNE